jgi:hypothetical protein
MKKPKPVVICREMLVEVDSAKERRLARRSVAKSAARLFPGYVYSHEEASRTDKLLVLSFTFEYSRWEAFRLRIKSWITGKPVPVLAVQDNEEESIPVPPSVN